MESQAPLPEQVYTSSVIRFEKQLDSLTTWEDTEAIRKGKEDFLLQSSFMIDDLMRSGRVLFNDTVGQYLNQIKDYLLRDQPDLREKIRVFLVRSPAVNAFCTNDGTILFNMGLLAKAENEAQVAFILCHEIQHFVKQHPLNRAVEQEKIKRNTDKILGESSRFNIMVATNRYSREQEEEADEQGLELYLNSAYDAEEALNTFEVLRLAMVPFAEVPWDPKDLEPPFSQIPEKLKLDSVQPIVGEEVYDELYSRHPSIESRAGYVKIRINQDERVEGKRYLLGQETFEKHQKVCRFEIAKFLVDWGAYERALYHIHLLKQDHPESPYLDLLQIQSLYGITRLKNQREFFDHHIDYEGVEGESQALYYFFEKIHRHEMNIIALDQAWRFHKKYPENAWAEYILQELAVDLYEFHQAVLEKMHREEPGNYSEDEEADPEGDVDPWKIKDHTGFDYAFAEYFEDPDFGELLKRAKSEAEEEDAPFLSSKEYQRKRKKEKKKGKKLGLQKVVFFSPLYKKFDEREDIELQYIESEVTQVQWEDEIGQFGEKLGLQVDVLALDRLDANQVEQYKDILLLRRLVDREFSEETQILSPSDKERLQELAKEYGTPYFAFTGAVRFKSKVDWQGDFSQCMAMLAMVGLPFFLYEKLSNTHGMIYISLVFDLVEDEVLLAEFDFYRGDKTPGLLKSRLYYSMMQMVAK